MDFLIFESLTQLNDYEIRFLSFRKNNAAGEQFSHRDFSLLLCKHPGGFV